MGIAERDETTSFIFGLYGVSPETDLHAQPLETLVDLAGDPRFQLVAAASRSKPDLGETPVFHDIGEMLANGPTLDAVALCTPPQARRETALAALRAGNIDLSTEDEQSWRQIAGEGGMTAVSLRCDVASIATVLEAIRVGFPPPFALIVINAARIEAQVAAQRAHIAQVRRGDLAGRLAQGGWGSCVANDFAEREARAESHPGTIRNAVQTGNAAIDSADTRSWLIGHFINEELGLRHTKDVELKWATHTAGEAREE